jgi:hypothetical protein
MFKNLFYVFAITLSCFFTNHIQATQPVKEVSAISWIEEISQITINSYNVMTFVEDGGPFGRFSVRVETYTVYYPLITCTSGEVFVAWQYRFNSHEACVQEIPSFLKVGVIVQINPIPDGGQGVSFIMKDVETGKEIFVHNNV